MVERTFTLKLTNCDLEAEQLEELIADALDGALPVDDSRDIVVDVEAAAC